MYSVLNDNGTWDLIKMSDDLYSLIVYRDLETLFFQIYEENQLEGIIDFLLSLGLSSTSIVKNLELYPKLSVEAAKQMFPTIEDPHEEIEFYN